MRFSRRRRIFPRLKAQFDENVWEQLRSGNVSPGQVNVLLKKASPEAA
jgi:hypothetical protein